jgi:hypothetical protein
MAAIQLLVLAGGLVGMVQAAPQAPPCPVSDDSAYGLTMEKPIRVGGGAMYMVARERRYLDALRGPAGETVTYTRSGSGGPPGQRGPIDIYRVSWPGLETPVTLYVDAYHFDDAPKAPKGLTCAGFSLGAPPVDAFAATDAMVRLAIETGPSADVPPVSLDADGSAAHGVALDQFRAIALFARAASAAGTPVQAAQLPKDLPGPGLRVYAYPVQCGDRTVSPASIEILPPQGPMVRRVGEVLTGDGVVTLTRGFTAPAGSIAAHFTLGMLRHGDTVRITYADVLCDGVSKERAIVARATPAKAVSLPPPALPAGMASAPPVWLQTVIDPQGRFQQALYIGGPEALLAPALEAIKNWRAEPARVNGTAVLFDTLLVVQFK